MKNERFAQFMFDRLHAYEGEVGRRVNVSEFADVIGAYQGNLSHWLNGTRVPGDKILQRLAANPIIGAGVWEAAGKVPALSPALRLILRVVGSLPPEEQERIASQIEQLARDDPQSIRENGGAAQTA